MTDKVLKFGSKTCGPCKMLAMTLLNEDIGVPVESVDIDESPELAQEYAIRGVPTMVLIRNDQEVSRLVGNYSLSRIKDWVVSN